MTNKFKFGDKVTYQACLYVVTAAVDDECFLISEGSYDAGIWADASKLTPASDWVKCSERLPKHGEMVLVFNGNSIEIDALAIGEFAFECWCDSVTHWMPLPTPPQD